MLSISPISPLITPVLEAPVVDVFAPDCRGSWFLLRTRSRHEKIVANELRSRGVPYFLPLTTAMRFYGHRKARVELPLFPGYVFLRGAREDAFAIDRTGRVAQIIDIVDQRRATHELSNIHLALSRDASLAHYPFLRKGVRVEVRSGPLRVLQGIVEDWAKRDRLILQVEILGRGVSLEVDGGLLDVID